MYYLIRHAFSLIVDGPPALHTGFSVAIFIESEYRMKLTDLYSTLDNGLL